MNEPKKIIKLDEVVVNRIAAGEIIQRPSNALKELIENSLDAKSTNIQILVKEGGLKLLQIQDNGTGINKEDMDVVCERFTTSKLKEFDDLQSLTTYGFRGEALASISHVAQVKITTKTANAKCAYVGSYLDGRLRGPVVPCAGNQGTIITAENLFYNVSTRRRALCNANEEFSKIREVVQRYAIHNPNVGFSLKKANDNKLAVCTPAGSSKKDNIRTIFGNEIERDLMEINEKDESYRFHVQILITGIHNYHGKRFTFLLFINNRLVDSSAIKKSIEDLYSVYWPKKSHPWCYMALELDPQNIDVNIHPTKHEVRFLHEESIIDRIRLLLDEKFQSANNSRTFFLENPTKRRKLDLEKIEMQFETAFSQNNDVKLPQKMFVRVDAANQKLEKFNFTSEVVTTNVNDDSLVQEQDSKIILENMAVGENKNEKSTVQNNMDVDECNTDKINHEGKIIDNNDLAHDQTKKLLEKNSIQLAHNKEVNHEKKQNLITDDPEVTLQIPYKKTQNVTTDDQEAALEKEMSQEAAEIEAMVIVDHLSEIKQKEYSNQQMEKRVTITDKKIRNSDTSLPENNLQNMDKLNEDSEMEVDMEKPTTSKTKKNENNDNGINATPRECSSPVEFFKSYSVNQTRVETKLKSILMLRKEVEENYNPALRMLFANLVFIGCIDETNAVIQSGVGLYLCNTEKLAEELFYEIMLYDFANYGVIKFSEPLLIKDIALLALENKDIGWSQESGDKEMLAQQAQDLLLEKADMLRQYFSIYINKNGYLKTLPILIENHFPSQPDLPMYILRLATEVDWTKEQPCFRDICRETAMFYSKIDISEESWQHTTEHIIYSAIRESLLPPNYCADNEEIISEMATLPELYKIFERC